MSAEACDLDAALDAAQRLVILLERQGEALDERECDQVGRLATEIAPVVEQLERAGGVLARRAGGGEPPERSRLVALLELGRRLNERNGARIAALRRHTRRALALLCAEPDAPALYGPRGDARGVRVSRYATTV